MAARPPRIGLALAGGGPLGAIYEIGALCALQDCIAGLDLNALDGYVGVSAGGFIAAGLANGMTARQLCTSFIENAGPEADRIDPSLFFRPALAEYLRRGAALPALVLQATAGALARQRRGGTLAALERLGRALPTGVFATQALQDRLERVFAAPGRSNDFRRLRRRLVVVATDLDTGRAAPFGLGDLAHVPISRAVVASAALPGLFTPVPIDGRWYVDGALKKTLHASVLLDMQLDLLICLNPLVPFSTGRHIRRLADGGLPVVLSQTFRSLIHSRLELGLKGYEGSHPGTDIVLFEPEQHDPEMFLANTFGYAQRRGVAEHAYQRTRADLRSRRSVLSRTLARHGLALDADALDDPQRTLLRRGHRAERPLQRELARLDEVLDDLDGALAARASQARPRHLAA